MFTFKRKPTNKHGCTNRSFLNLYINVVLDYFKIKNENIILVKVKDQMKSNVADVTKVKAHSKGKYTNIYIFV